jgi:hypothetical protein
MLKRLLSLIVILFVAFNFNASAQKADPWIIQAYKEMYGRQPTTWELNIKNYNLGSWNNYPQLKEYIKEYQNSMQSNGYTVSVTALANNQSKVTFLQNGTAVAVGLIGNDAGSLIGNDAGSLVGNDGASLAAISFADVATKFTQASGIKYVKASGRGRIVFKKRH